MPRCPRCHRNMIRTPTEWVCDGLTITTVDGRTRTLVTHPIIRKQRFLKPVPGTSMLFLAEAKDEKTRKWLDDLSHQNDEAGKERYHWYQKDDGTIVEKVGDKIVNFTTVAEFCQRQAKRLEEKWHT